MTLHINYTRDALELVQLELKLDAELGIITLSDTHSDCLNLSFFSSHRVTR